MTIGNITRIKFVKCNDGFIAVTSRSELFSLRIRFKSFSQWNLILKNFGYRTNSSGYFIYLNKYKEMFDVTLE